MTFTGKCPEDVGSQGFSVSIFQFQTSLGIALTGGHVFMEALILLLLQRSCILTIRPICIMEEHFWL